MKISLYRLIRKNWEIHYYYDPELKNLKKKGYIYRATYRGKKVRYAWDEDLYELLTYIAYFEFYRRKKNVIMPYKRNDFFRIAKDYIPEFRKERNAERKILMDKKIPKRAVSVWPKS
jgi:hypothetical protein